MEGQQELPVAGKKLRNVQITAEGFDTNEVLTCARVERAGY